MPATFITGREYICGFKKATTWRTAVALGALDGLLVRSESLGAKAPEFVDDDSLGQADPLYSIKTFESQGGSLTGILRYDMWDLMIACALGTAGTPSNEEGSAYSNSFTVAASIADIFGTFASKKSGTTHSIWEVPSCMITGFTIRGEVGQLCEITCNIMGNKVQTESAINTDLSSVTYRDRGNQARMDSRTRIYMNSQSGAALGESDSIYPLNFEITYNRPFRQNREAGFDDASQPVQDGFADAMVRFNFDKYNLDTFTDAITDEADQKILILLEGSIISGSTRYKIQFDFPRVSLRSVDAPVGGPGTIPHNVEGRLLGVTAAPTGMTATGPLGVYVINTRSVSPLA